MKPTLSTVYPPPPQTVQKQQQQQHIKTPQKLSGFQRGSLAGRQSSSHAFLSSCFAMQHLKYVNGISLAGRWLLGIVCWLHVLYRQLEDLH